MLSFDVCIVGAGPAGLALAKELDGGPYRVCLLESGAREPTARAQDLANGAVELNRDCYDNPAFLHARAVGGTAHRWCISIDDETYFRVGKLEPIDFEARRWLPHSGWPLDAAELEPYYRRALDRCGLGSSSSFDSMSWADSAHQPVPSISGRLESQVYLFGRQRVFLHELPGQMTASGNVMLLTDSTCVELESVDGGARVTRARVRTFNGRQFFVAARAVVLAQSGFEVPRLLLASRADVGRGLGNQHDLVGRYLTDHQLVKAGSIVAVSRQAGSRLGFYDTRVHREVPVAGKLSIADKALDDEQILASALMLVPRPSWSPARVVQHLFGRETTARSPALASAMTVRRSIKHHTWPRNLARHCSNMIRGADDLVYGLTRYHSAFQPRYTIDQGGWSEPAAPGVNTIEAIQICEQAPDPGNRITLSNDRDALGMPKPAVRLTWGDFDRQSVCRAQDIFSQELETAGVGRLASLRRDGDPMVRQISAHHPAGTTRMSSDPRSGVVDADCRVHGTNNLFVASSSVFPTSGYTPPTLTILALAIRLADELVSILGYNDLPPIL